MHSDEQNIVIFHCMRELLYVSIEEKTYNFVEFSLNEIEEIV